MSNHTSIRMIGPIAPLLFVLGFSLGLYWGPGLSGASAADLPDWTESGGWNLPSNPYTLIQPKSAQENSDQFKRVIEASIRTLILNNESLELLSIRVWDLHDLSIGDLKATGLHYEKSPWFKVPSGLSSEVADTNPSVRLLEYFKIPKYDPEKTSDERVMSGEEMMSHLAALKLVKNLILLETILPPVRSAIQGARVSIEKLIGGLSMDTSQFSEDRLAELQAEFVTTLRAASQTATELARLHSLQEALNLWIHYSEANQWTELAGRFHELLRRFLIYATDAGIDFPLNQDGYRTHRAQLESDLAQIAETQRPACESFAREGLAYINRDQGSVKVGGYEFPLLFVCYAGSAYMIRQPGDFTRYLTTQIIGQVPSFKIFYGSRPVSFPPTLNWKPKSDRRRL